MTIALKTSALASILALSFITSAKAAQPNQPANLQSAITVAQVQPLTRTEQHPLFGVGQMMIENIKMVQTGSEMMKSNDPEMKKTGEEMMTMGNANLQKLMPMWMQHFRTASPR
jgi:hypothetical protein